MLSRLASCWRHVVIILLVVLLGSDFGRTDFSRIFIFGPGDSLADLVAGIVSPHFCGEKVPRKIFQENPGQNAKILQNLHNKNPRRISAEGLDQVLLLLCG